ncbi:hypothetical protein KO317_00470 [Candidatus Micrarchaeota archaeon]|jgi:glucan phosphoethanolaminetransferase (alkaline phosphatase superfamily)|nr:hypothetical protein [Candidatus Micrarchaeota archaeon]
MEEEVFFNWRKKERELLNHLQVIVINIVLSTCASIMTYIQYWDIEPLYKGLMAIVIILFSASIAVFKRKFARFWIFVLLIWISYIIALNTFFELFWGLVLIILLCLYILISKTKFFEI